MQQLEQLHRMIDSLIAERDEARREFCKLSARKFRAQFGDSYPFTAEHIAKARNWDCFED